MARMTVLGGMVVGMLAATSLAPLWAQGVGNPLAPEPIELPGVISRWQSKMPEDLPPISIDDIEKCMGAQVGLGARRQAVEGTRAALVQQAQSLEADQHDLSARRERALAEREQIKVGQAGLDAASQRIRAQRAELDLAKGRPPRSPQDRQALVRQIDQFNAQVKAYNLDVAAVNRQVAAANRAVAEFNAAREAFNARVATLQARQQVHAEQVAVFNGELQGLQARCDGQRRLVKEAAAAP